VVGAATIAPVGAYVSSLRVSAERCTISRQRPLYRERRSQPRQNATVASNSAAMSAPEYGIGISPGSTRSSTKVAVCPARRVMRARTSQPSTISSGRRVERLSPSSGARNRAPCGVSATSWLAPPVVEARGYVDNEVHLPTDCEDLANHAVVVHRLAGMRWGHEVLHLPTPSGVKKRVMRIGVWDVKLLERQPSQSGEMRNRPPWSASRMAAKTLGESNRGQQYQSIVPSVPTSATVCRSPIRPCSAIGR
jgi:hypothetical protein